MGLIQDWLRRLKAKKEDKSSYARQRYVEEDYDRRKLNSNERELARFREEERQRRVKAALERHRKRDNHKVWSGRHGNPLYAKNVTAGHKKLFNSGNMFAKVPDAVHNRNVVNARNVVATTPNIFHRRKK